MTYKLLAIWMCFGPIPNGMAALQRNILSSHNASTPNPEDRSRKSEGFFGFFQGM